MFGNLNCPFFQSTSNEGGESAEQPPKNPKDFGDIINKGTGASDLENKLKNAGWTSKPAVGGKNSGSGNILTSPDGKSSVRVMTRPDGSSYARIYNGPGGGGSGEQALNLQGKPGKYGKADNIDHIHN